MTRQQKAAAGVGLVFAGAWLLHQAYENAGKRRPFPVSMLP